MHESRSQEVSLHQSVLLHPHLSAEAARLHPRHHIADGGADPRPHQPLPEGLVEDEVAERAVEGRQLRAVDRVEVQAPVLKRPAAFHSGSENQPR